MSGDRFLMDTNAIIFHLSGNKNVEAVLDNSVVCISSITFTELLSGKLNNQETIVLQEYLKAVDVVHTNDFICETAATFRKDFKIKLPDANCCNRFIPVHSTNQF